MIETMMVMQHRAPMVAKPELALSLQLQSEMRAERVGQRLQLLRLALGLKPSEIADMLGMERTYWSRFENGKRRLTEAQAVSIVERFGVTLDFLLLGRWGGLPLDLAETMRRVELPK